MNSKQKSSSRFLAVTNMTVILTLLCFGFPAIAAHDMCPDYSEYSGMLNNGQAQLESTISTYNSSSSIGPDSARYDSRPWRTFSALKNPKLQYSVQCARAAEGSESFNKAAVWWNGIADELKKDSADSENKYYLSRALSRLADIEVISSRSDIKSDDYEFAASTPAPKLTTKSPVPTGPETKGNGLSKIFRRPSYEASLDYGASAPPNEFRSRRTSPRSQSSLIPPLSTRLQSRLLRTLLATSTISGAPNKKLLLQAKNHYKAAIEVSKGLDNQQGLNPLCAADLVKLAMLYRCAGDVGSADQSLADAIEVLLASQQSLPDFEYLQSSPRLSSVVSNNLVSFSLSKSISPEKIKILELKLKQYFDETWLPAAMKCYAARNDKPNVVRLFSQYRPNQPDNSLSWLDRLDMGDSLFQVGATTEVGIFCNLWTVRSSDALGYALSELFFAQLAIKRGLLTDALDRIERALAALDEDKSGDELTTKAKLEIASKVVSILKLEKSQRGVHLLTSAQKLNGQSRHRLMQLECLHLAKQLSLTGADLEAYGNYPEASKMYAASCDIKTKNLGANDIEAAKQRLDLSRTLALSGNLQESKSNSELAIKAIRLIKDGDLLRSALESYADVLSQLNQSSQAESVYEELRAM